MDEKALMDFIGIFIPFDHLKVDKHEHLKELKQSIKSGFWKFIERVRNNLYELASQGANPVFYINGLLEKINDHIEYLFEEREGFIYSHSNKIIINPVREGDIISEAGHYQYLYLQKAINYLTKQLTLVPSLSSPEKPITQRNFKRGIISRAYGFRILNPRNLYRAWKLLGSDDNKIISKEVSDNTFERNFSGRMITQRITWIESENCLHYFIDGIAGNHEDQGTGIEKEDAIWIKASLVFEKEDGTLYDSDLLSHANRKPTDIQMKKLNQIILQMNKLPKERLS